MAKKNIVSVLVFFLTVWLVGCVSFHNAVRNEDSRLWWMGKIIDQVKAPYEETVTAAKGALAALGMDILKLTTTSTVTQLKSKYKDGTMVWIDIHPLTADTSKIQIRVSLDGNMDASLEILDEVKAQL